MRGEDGKRHQRKRDAGVDRLHQYIDTEGLPERTVGFRYNAVTTAANKPEIPV